MIAHLSLLGWVPASGNIPMPWYGIYDPIKCDLIQNYSGTTEFFMDVIQGFSHAEMTRHGDCYAAWVDIPDDWLMQFCEYLERNPSDGP